MDFYFCNNIPKFDLEIVLSKFDKENGQWIALLKGFAFFWFDQSHDTIQLQILDDFNKTYNKFNILDLKSVLCDEDLNFKFAEQKAKEAYGISFQNQQQFDLFRKYFMKFQQIQTKIEKQKHQNFSKSLAKELIIEYIEDETFEPFEILPLTIQLTKENNFMQILFTVLYHKIDDANINKEIKKKLFIFIAKIFQFQNRNFLRKILLNQKKFELLENLIIRFNQIYLPDQVDQCNYKKFQYDCMQLIEMRILQKIKQERIDYAVRLRYLTQNFLRHLLSEKYLQVYQKMIDNSQHKIFCSVLKNDQNIKIIVSQIEQKKYQRFDFLVELLHSFDKHLFQFDKAISFLNQHSFMNFLRRILQKIEFIQNQNQLFIKIRCSYFQQYEKFIKFLEFVGLFIQRNPVCFVSQIFPVNQRQEHYKSLKCLLTLLFQSNYQNLQYITLQLLQNVINNIKRLTEDNNDYYQLVGSILLELFKNYKFLNSKLKTLQFYDSLMINNNQTILEKIFENEDVQECLVDVIIYSQHKLKRILAAKSLLFICDSEKLQFQNRNTEMKLIHFLQYHKFKKLNIINLQIVKLQESLEIY